MNTVDQLLAARAGTDFVRTTGHTASGFLLRTVVQVTIMGIYQGSFKGERL